MPAIFESTPDLLIFACEQSGILKSQDLVGQVAFDERGVLKVLDAAIAHATTSRAPGSESGKLEFVTLTEPDLSGTG